MMFVFFMALILQAVLEREVRQSMADEDIDAIPVYPEHRLAHHPTTARFIDRFRDLSLYRLHHGDKFVKQYQDDLTELQSNVLKLLGLKDSDYWKCVA